jgi:shikimate kinase / 3-dehydroquinate synthase
MQTVDVTLADRRYPIYIGEKLLQHGDLLARHLPQKRVALVTDTNLAPLYLDAVISALKACGIAVTPIVISAGESQKNWQTLNSVFDALLLNRCERKTALVALGGGVIGDLTGFAAATFLRGVPFIQMPTTLLAQVDSSVGGKTAVNHPRGKNMIGAFYQPLAVIADTSTLDTLPAREVSAGIAEIIKYGIIRDVPFFEWLEANIEALVARDPSALAHAVEISCENKAQVVAADEREEHGDRALLNFGHTFGHAIETGLGYGAWLHGEAVGAGMVIAARVSQAMGILKAADVDRIVAIVTRAGLPVTAPDFGLQRYMELMGIDKKVESGKIRFILLRAIGAAFLTADVPAKALAAGLSASVAHE